MAWLAALVAARGGHAQEIANGVFLVAQPTMTNATFRRTVILITQRPDGGSLGVIINRPTDVPLKLALSEYPQLAALPQTLHFGGPVQPQTMLFLVRAAAPGPYALPVLRDVYLTTDAQAVNDAVAQYPVAVRAFTGYAGWAPGQLRSEMQRDGWYILPADSASIFDKSPQELWPELARRAVLRPTGLVTEIQ